MIEIVDCAGADRFNHHKVGFVVDARQLHATASRPLIDVEVVEFGQHVPNGGEPSDERACRSRDPRTQSLRFGLGLVDPALPGFVAITFVTAVAGMFLQGATRGSAGVFEAFTGPTVAAGIRMAPGLLCVAHRAMLVIASWSTPLTSRDGSQRPRQLLAKIPLARIAAARQVDAIDHARYA